MFTDQDINVSFSDNLSTNEVSIEKHVVRLLSCVVTIFQCCMNYWDYVTE